MKIKLWASAILLLILTCAVVWLSGFPKIPANGSSNRTSPRNPGETTSGGDGHSGLPKKSPRSNPAKSNQIEVVDQLENLAKASPELIDRLTLPMFDNNLSPYLEDWELLGLGKEEAELVSAHLRSIFQKIRDREAGSFKIIDQTEHRVQISIPKFGDGDAANYRARIESSYAKVFGPELSKQMTRLFLDHHASIAGGINGRERVITITTASADAISKLNRKYEIRTQTLFEGTKVSDALGNLDNYTQDNGIELVENVPESWAHLFGNSD
jgi:hypothetical protein